MKIAVVGLGPIGIEVAWAVLTEGARRRGGEPLSLVAVADISPALAGRPLRALIPVVAGADGREAPSHALDISVDGTVAQVLARGVDAIALCTSSRVAGVLQD